MGNVKLDLKGKDVPGKIAMGNTIKTALGDPAAAPYTAPAADLKAKTAALDGAHSASEMANATAVGMTADMDLAETAFDSSYAALGREVQTTTLGDTSAIMATGYAVRSAPNPATSLEYVLNFSVTTTNMSGVLDFTWDRSKGEVNYEIRGRKASDPAGTYSFSKTTSKTRLRASGFESGTEYTFQIRAHGAKEMESPWCDPFTKIAA